MTQFWRSAYWRTSVNGVPHRVEGHWVDRDDWDRSSSNFHQSYFAAKLRELDAHAGATSAFVVPNAHCPVCGALVFFYQNQFGSRVYFDELGPPWPKHPCTDTGAAVSLAKASPVVYPTLRSREERGAISAWSEHAAFDPQQEFYSRFNLSQWAAFHVSARLKAGKELLLVLDPLNTEGRRLYLVIPRRFGKSLAIGALVFAYRGWLSYFDMQSMSGVEVEGRRLPGASAVIDTVVNSQVVRK